MAECSIYRCQNIDGLEKGGDCNFCGNWYLCQKHINYKKHVACKKKIYFKVDYEDRKEAKKIGLFYDTSVKKWYASNPLSYEMATGIFDEASE